jgi:hypothetical protein
VAVSATDVAYRDRMRAEVENGVLKIWFDGKGWNSGSGNKKLRPMCLSRISIN